MRKALVAVVSGMALAACGGGSGGVTGASAPAVPQVAGNYSGTVTVSLPELGLSQTCPASTVVTQSGNTVNIAPIVASGQCGGEAVTQAISVVIDSSATISMSGSLGASCGVYSWTATGGFYGREMRFQNSATSATCWNQSTTGVLSR